MKIAIVEDDQWIAELLRQVLVNIADDAETTLFGTLGQALNHLKSDTPDVLICDLNLPDGSGLDVINACRHQKPGGHRVLITSQIERATVLAAREAGVTHFIAKPFKVEQVIARLRELLNQSATANASSMDGLNDLRAFLTQQLEQKLFIPWSRSSTQQEALNLDSNCDERALVRLARLEPILLAGLMHRANRDQAAENNFDCVSVEQAIEQLGLETSRELTLQLARTGAVLRDPSLCQMAEELMQQQTVLADALTRLAQHQSISSPPVEAAISLCRLGEMATLCAIQNFVDYGQGFDPSECEPMLHHFAPEYGNRIKVGLKLPFVTRELIGSVFKLPQGSLRKDRVVMRIAALETGLDDDPVELARLRKWIGLPAK
ncbi:MAG: response regulator [Pseudomonas sp.]|nr:response regulator [Pseudomonas sp.]